MDRLELAQAHLQGGPEEDPGAEAPGPPPVRVEDGPAVRRAEPPAGVERLAERDVIDALGENGLEVRRLGPRPLATQRAAGPPEGIGEMDVRAGARGEPGHGPHGGGSPAAPHARQDDRAGSERDHAAVVPTGAVG